MKKEIVLLETSPDGGKLSYIQFLRGLSILSIVLFHIIWAAMQGVPEVVRRLLWPFCYATRIFFFCSGFGLYYSQLRRPKTYSVFLRKRFLNIYLPYIGAILICFLVSFTYDYDDRFPALLSHIFLYKMFLPDKVQSFGPYWYMSAIFLYYLLFYALIRFKKRVGNSRRFLLFWILVSLGSCALGSLIPGLGGKYLFVYNAMPVMHCCFFALGMNTAEKLHQTGRVTISVRTLAVCSAVFLALYLLVERAETKFMNEIPTTMIVFCLFTILWAVSTKWKAFRRWIYWLASVSFEWYLLHMLFIECFSRYVSQRGLAFNALIGAASFAVSLLAAWLYHKLVMGIRNMFRNGRQPSA